MQINQSYEMINATNHQIYGDAAVDVNDLSGLISLGKQFSGDIVGADKFIGKLVDRIGKTILRTLDLELDYPSLYTESFTFGAMLQKININPIDAIRSSEYDIGENNFTPTFADIHKYDNVHVAYFTDMDTFKFVTTIPHNLFFTAFQSESGMVNFLDGLIESMTNSVTISVNNFSRQAVNNFIAEKILAGNGIVDLVGDYNKAYGLSGDDAKDAAACRVDKEFWRYTSTVVRKWIAYLSQPSTLYNTGINGNPIVRTTQRDNMHVFFLADTAAAFDAYLLSDSYKDLFGLPYYNEVAFWQGNKAADGAINDYDTNSSIDIIPSSQKSVTLAANRYAVKQDGVAIVLADRQAIFMTINKLRSSSFNNDLDDYTNYGTTVSQTWCNDLSENGVIFLITDSIVTPGITLDESTLTFASSAADPKSLVATTMPKDAVVTWKTSKAAVATVSDGTVTPAGAGDCTITAEITVGGTKYSATCSVTVGS